MEINTGRCYKLTTKYATGGGKVMKHLLKEEDWVTLHHLNDVVLARYKGTKMDHKKCYKFTQRINNENDVNLMFVEPMSDDEYVEYLNAKFEEVWKIPEKRNRASINAFEWTDEVFKLYQMFCKQKEEQCQATKAPQAVSKRPAERSADRLAIIAEDQKTVEPPAKRPRIRKDGFSPKPQPSAGPASFSQESYEIGNYDRVKMSSASREQRREARSQEECTLVAKEENRNRYIIRINGLLSGNKSRQRQTREKFHKTLEKLKRSKDMNLFNLKGKDSPSIKKITSILKYVTGLAQK